MAVLETLLLGLDYVTHERFTHIFFEKNHREELFSILQDCFIKTKQHGFSEFANRPVLNKSSWIQNGEEIYCLDERTDKTRIYMAAVYRKPKNTMEHLKNVAHIISKVDFKPSTRKVSFEEMLEGKTDHGIHQDTLYFFGMIQRTLSWLLNSTSWRNNQLFGFDELEICCKLGLK